MGLITCFHATMCKLYERCVRLFRCYKVPHVQNAAEQRWQRTELHSNRLRLGADNNRVFHLDHVLQTQLHARIADKHNFSAFNPGVNRQFHFKVVVTYLRVSKFGSNGTNKQMINYWPLERMLEFNLGMDVADGFA